MTIYDIAKITGYSSATVARALSGHGYCSAKAKQEVTEAAKANHYIFNSQARSLRSHKVNTIICGIPDICNPFYFQIIQGATEVMRQKGYMLILYPTEKAIEKELEAIQICQRKLAGGLILMSFNFCDENIRAIRESGIPTVLGNQYPGQKSNDSFDYCYVDHTLGMELATNHLLNKGCQNILLVTGSLKEQTTRERAKGYLKALADAGKNPNKDYMINGNYVRSDSKKAVDLFLKEKKPFDGVIAANDLSALGILDSLKEHHLSVPEQIKMVSFDNTDLATITNPPLTSIDMRQHDLGVSMAATLIERIEGRNGVKNTIIKPTLIERGSSK